MSRALPPPPNVEIAIAGETTATARATGGFLNLRRLSLSVRYGAAPTSAPFDYDVAVRAALDAVVVAAHYREGGKRWVYLRSAVRPPVALRDRPPAHPAALWELPAGLHEDGESEAETAARELEEELGFKVRAGALRPLGPWAFPAPAFIAERHVFFEVEVQPSERGVPSEDGSALEREAAIVAVPVDEALAACRAGTIRDAKTELALRRLAELP